MSTPDKFHTIHFFVLLPEPLALPSGFAIQHEERPGTYKGESFRVWEGAHLTVNDLRAGPICRFFHRETPFDLSRSIAARGLAHWVWPSLGAEKAEDAPGGEQAEQPPEARDHPGLHGGVDQAETIGGGQDDTGAGSESKVQTAAELIYVVGCSEQIGEDLLEDTFQHGLRMVQALQRAIYAITRQPYTLLTKASAAFITPVAIGTISDGEFEPPREVQPWRNYSGRR